MESVAKGDRSVHREIPHAGDGRGASGQRVPAAADVGGQGAAVSDIHRATGRAQSDSDAQLRERIYDRRDTVGGAANVRRSSWISALFARSPGDARPGSVGAEEGAGGPW